MATREAIRTDFRSELLDAIPSSGQDGHVPDADVTIERPDGDEDLPAIVIGDAWRRRPINQASTGPTSVTRDNSGNVTEERYARIEEGRFSLLFWFIDEGEKEACYEAVKGHFERYEESPWDPTDINADVAWVRVRDAQSDDDADATPVRHGDRLLISIIYSREAVYPTDSPDSPGTITDVDHEVDADNDGTTDATWTSS